MTSPAARRPLTTTATVRSLPRRDARRGCARPGCPATADATLTFSYDQRDARLLPLAADASPAMYDLCATHAARTRPPHGWMLTDERPGGAAPAAADAIVPGTPAGTGMPVHAPTRIDAHGGADRFGERTVAVLAAALRAVPGPAPVPPPEVPSPVLAAEGRAGHTPRPVPAAARRGAGTPTQLVLDDRTAGPGTAEAW